MTIEEYIGKHLTAERDAECPGMFYVLMDGLPTVNLKFT